MQQQKIGITEQKRLLEFLEISLEDIESGRLDESMPEIMKKILNFYGVTNESI
ncbi:MAG TPA: hypothetical protein P5277_02610 [Candidatus Paceibacterota bacterium]|nr:hypothetical protein [Candidatus Paceibacterota bacterium]